MAKDKDDVLTIEFKKNVNLGISIKDINGAQNTLNSIKKLALDKSPDGQLICAEFVDRVFKRTSRKKSVFSKSIFRILSTEVFSIMAPRYPIEPQL